VAKKTGARKAAKAKKTAEDARRAIAQENGTRPEKCIEPKGPNGKKGKKNLDEIAREVAGVTSAPVALEYVDLRFSGEFKNS
jgi:hypothetical protein